MRVVKLQRGYVLLIMLVYLQVFSLLAMQAVASITYQQKISRQRMSINELHRDARRVMTNIDGMPTVPCVIGKMSLMQLSLQNLKWWQNRGCHLSHGEIEYFYVREMLVRDDCAIIISPNKQRVAPVYYRNTLLQVSPLNQHVSFILQDTIAVAGSLPPVCNGRLKSIKAGRQMLRWW